MEEKLDKLFNLLTVKTDLRAVERWVVLSSIADNPNKIHELEEYLNSDKIDRNEIFENFIPKEEKELNKRDTTEVNKEKIKCEIKKKYEEMFNKENFYEDWKRERFDDAKLCISYMKKQDILNKKIKSIKMFGRSELISKQMFVDEYNNEYLKSMSDFRKRVSLSDFPEEAEFVKSISTDDPIMIVFDDDTTLDIWFKDYGVVEVSTNKLKNHIRFSSPNVDANKMLSEIINRKIIDISYKPIEKDSQIFDWYVENKDVEEPIEYIILKLDNGSNLMISNYTIFIGSLEKGAVLVPLKEYLKCIYNYEDYFD